MCQATWSGTDSETIETSCDVNAIGAGMEEVTYSDGVMSCVVWGDSPPHSVTWSDEAGNTVLNVTEQVQRFKLLLLVRGPHFIIRLVLR